MSSLAGDPLELLIRLRPTASTASECTDKNISFESRPENGLQLKQAIENELQIPVCFQTISLKSAIITDGQLLSELYLRKDDVLTVEYTTEADTKDMNEILRLLQSFIPTDCSLDMADINPNDPFTVEELVRKCLHPPTSERTKANRLHFVSKNGIQTCLLIYKTLAPLPWESMTIEKLLLERLILLLLCDLSAANTARQLLMKQPTVVEHLRMSILKAEIHPYKLVVLKTADGEAVNSQLQLVVMEIMIRAMGIITNLSELPYNRLEIASQPGMIEQMTSALLSPSFSLFSNHIIVSALVNLSYTPTTHPYLIAPPILNGVVDACKKHSDLNNVTANIFVRQGQANNITILKYYTALFFSFISAGSDNFVASESFGYFAKDILDFMKRFLKKHTHQQIIEVEKEAGYSWSTITPLMSLVYCNETITGDSKTQKLAKELNSTGVSVGLFSLNVICTTASGAEVLEKEGLVDFLIYLPWYVRDEHRESASEIVTSYTENTTTAIIKPPRLLNMAKARIATMGLSLNELLLPNFMDKIAFYMYPKLHV